MGKEKKQMKLINDLPNVFRSILKKYNLAPGDFPVSKRWGFVHSWRKQQSYTFPLTSGLYIAVGYQYIFGEAEGGQVFRIFDPVHEADRRIGSSPQR